MTGFGTFLLGMSLLLLGVWAVAFGVVATAEMLVEWREPADVIRDDPGPFKTRARKQLELDDADD